MAIKIFSYDKCSTCRDAIKFLDSKKASYEKIAIVDQPPSVSELKKMLSFLKEKGGSIKSLFNTSGIQYRELKMAEKFEKGLTDTEAFQLLSKNGKLVKRPFLLSDKSGVVGFKIEEWKKFI